MAVLSPMINPALELYPKEAALIGSRVVGYGELDLTMVNTAGIAMGMKFELLDALDEVWSERTRVEIVAKLARPGFKASGFAEQFEIALEAMHECREIRNYLAHCHYGYFVLDEALIAVKARDLFADGQRDPKALPWRVLTVDTLMAQKVYFEYARRWWLWLEHALLSVEHKRAPQLTPPKPIEIPPRDAGSYVSNPIKA